MLSFRKRPEPREKKSSTLVSSCRPKSGKKKKPLGQSDRWLCNRLKSAHCALALNDVLNRADLRCADSTAYGRQQRRQPDFFSFCSDGTIDLWSCRRNLPRAAATERLERARALTPVSFSSSPASPSSSLSSCVPGYRALPSWISSPRSTSPSVLSRVPPDYPSCR
jgi:hypothetical protein